MGCSPLNTFIPSVSLASSVGQKKNKQRPHFANWHRLTRAILKLRFHSRSNELEKIAWKSCRIFPGMAEINVDWRVSLFPEREPVATRMTRCPSSKKGKPITCCVFFLPSSSSPKYVEQRTHCVWIFIRGNFGDTLNVANKKKKQSL